MSETTIRAYYMTRKGAGGVRPIRTAEDAEKILKGGFNATTVRLETDTGELVGQRWKDRGRWLWFYDQDYFKGAL